MCAGCIKEFSRVESPFCSCCGKMFKTRVGSDHVCRKCLDTPPAFKKTRTVGIYQTGFRKIIQRFKYNGKIQMADPLGRLLFNVFEHSWKPKDIDLITPVPLHIKKFRSRGFNQVYLLIRKWSHGEIIRDLLERKIDTKPQAGLDRKARKKNIKGAFNVKPDYMDLIQGKKILLVDDVFTTGATVNECAGILLKNGAGRVDVLTLARTKEFS